MAKRNAPQSESISFPDPRWVARLQRRLSTWYAKHARVLPWRGTQDPYRVWVSEIMLQQTQVETVKPFYARFLASFPDVRSLAAATEERVLRHWEGLGYYRRARQLHRAAQVIVAEYGAEFPNDPEQVRRLPGIGRYTAGAILSIAFGLRESILEANTVRLYSRLLALRGDPHGTAGQKTLWQFATEILPRKNLGAFNQALMELGSQVCLPRQPRCTACPVWELCPTQRLGAQATIPLPKKKPQFEAVQAIAVLIERQGKVLLHQCGPTERWAGLWDFLRFTPDATNSEEGLRQVLEQVRQTTGLKVRTRELLSTLKHGVTRFRITLDCYLAEVVAGRLPRGRADLRWVKITELDDYPLNTTGRKIAQRLAKRKE